MDQTGLIIIGVGCVIIVASICATVYSLGLQRAGLIQHSSAVERQQKMADQYDRSIAMQERSIAISEDSLIVQRAVADQYGRAIEMQQRAMAMSDEALTLQLESNALLREIKDSLKSGNG
ncbi:MAG TPA: hypothetical protein VGK19_00075 [Capsulimonadaceae bacterium]|jgi:uncharacterized protein involved in high-affinity Fe2+ transport